MRIKLKSTLLSAVGIFAIGAMITIASCKEDKCKSVVCANNGICLDDGSCQCQIGFQGERCETVTRDRFKGSWAVTEDGTKSSPARYASSIENADKINKVLIRNFYNEYNGQVIARVSGDTIYIAKQKMQVGDHVLTVQGKGYCVPEAFYDLHGKIIMHYQIDFEDGTVDKFGINGADNVSIWVK